MKTETQTLVDRARLTEDEHYDRFGWYHGDDNLHWDEDQNAQLAKALWAVVDDIEDIDEIAWDDEGRLILIGSEEDVFGNPLWSEMDDMRNAIVSRIRRALEAAGLERP